MFKKLNCLCFYNGFYIQNEHINFKKRLNNKKKVLSSFMLSVYIYESPNSLKYDAF